MSDVIESGHIYWCSEHGSRDEPWGVDDCATCRRAAERQDERLAFVQKHAPGLMLAFMAAADVAASERDDAYFLVKAYAACDAANALYSAIDSQPL